MAERRPIVIVGGKPQEIAHGDKLPVEILPDFLPGDEESAEWTPTFIPDGVTYTIPFDTQLLTVAPVKVDGTIVIDGTLVLVGGSTVVNEGGGGGGGGGGGSTGTSIATATTGVLNPKVPSALTPIVLDTVYRVMSIETSVSARVEFYVTTAAQSDDLGRPIGIDPPFGSGMVLDFATVGGRSYVMNPFVDGANLETVPTSTISMTVTNLSGSPSDVVVTVTFVGACCSCTKGETTVTTASLAPNQSTAGTPIGMAETYRVFSIATSRSARVRLYGTTAQQAADINRVIGTDADPQAGVLLDFATVGGRSYVMNPFVDGASLEIAPTGDIPMTVTNLSTTTGPVEVSVGFFS